MLTPEEIDAWEWDEESKADAEAYETVKKRYNAGTQRYRLLMPNEEERVVRHAMLLESLLETMTDAFADLVEQVEEQSKSAIGVFDRHGEPRE